jgi:aspartate aminotransferase
VSGVYGKKWQHPEKGEQTISTSFGFYEYLLSTALVAVIPGDGFGADEYVRMSYATSNEQIEKGVARIAEAVKRLD